MQRELNRMRHFSCKTMQKRLNDPIEGAQSFLSLKNAQEGYYMIYTLHPALQQSYEGWTYVFNEGWPLIISTPGKTYKTTNVVEINWDSHTFMTRDAVYSFARVDTEMYDKP